MHTRLGMSLIELMVAATVIISGMAVIGKLTVLSGRMWQQTRHERMALEELSNQLERLSALPPPQRDAAIAELAPSSYAADMLAGAKLSARAIQDADGLRLELHINWDRPLPSTPMSLVGWIDAVEVDQDASQEPST